MGLFEQRLSSFWKELQALDALEQQAQMEPGDDAPIAQA